MEKSQRHSRYIDFSLSPETFIIQTGKYSRTILQTSRRYRRKKLRFLSPKHPFQIPTRFNSIPQQAVGQSYPPRLPEHIIPQHCSFVNYFSNICSFCCFIVRILKKKTLFLTFLVVLYRKMAHFSDAE